MTLLFYQTFSPFDLVRLIFLFFLEIVLSADNAIVLGLLTKPLSRPLRKRALFIGLLSAFFLRAVILLFLSFFLKALWLQIFGAAYLLYLSLRYFSKTKSAALTHFVKNERGFWQTVLLIEFFDLAFALDSAVAGIAFIGPSSSQDLIHPKLWIVYVGAISGLILIRYAATLFSHLLDRFPKLEQSGYLLIGWIGLKMGIESFSHIWEIPNSFIYICEIVFWIGFIGLFSLGLRATRK